VIIEKNKAVLLFRYNNYKKTDFIEEHNNAADENGYVWMLKAGRKLIEAKLCQVKDESGIMILKAPKNAGGNYYCAQIFNYWFGSPNKSMNFPVYYEELIDDERLWQIESLDGTWLKIGKITALSSETVQELRLISNNKKIEDVIGSTMSSTLYVQSDKKLII
jgi:hypothetical protein